MVTWLGRGVDLHGGLGPTGAMMILVVMIRPGIDVCGNEVGVNFVAMTVDQQAAPGPDVEQQ